MKAEVTVNWENNLEFNAEVNGHKLIMDAGLDAGGNDKGPRPKPLLLAALGGCTGMDVVSILKKMQVSVESFKMYISGNARDEHPKYYDSIHVIYELKGKNLPLDKIQKAIALSEEKYCGVGALYRKAIPVTSEIKLIE